MTTQRAKDLFKTLAVLGILAIGVLALQGIGILLHGNVCNYSSTDIWLTISESGWQKVHSLAPGQCTRGLTQDAEAIWGRDCSAHPCRYQAWKVRAGRFEVYEHKISSMGAVLRIDGWGAGSRWQVTEEWPKPDLSSINYSLVK
jgi:hypothetical protein